MANKAVKTVATLLTVILIPVLVVAGVYGFVWWKVGEAADGFAADIAPFADMQYEKIYIDLPGAQVGLEGVSFQPEGMEGKILLSSAVLKAPSWGFLLDLESKLSKGELPESFNIDLKGLNLDLHSGYMQDWGRIATDIQRDSGPGYDAIACGGLQYFSLSDVRKMGYSNMQTDLALQYDFDSVDKQLNFDLQSKTALVADMSMSMSVQVASDTLNMQTIMFAQPQLKRVETRFYDRGYNQRRNAFCAKLNEETVQEYRARYTELLSKRLTYEGWVIPESVFTAFDSLNNPGGSAYLRVDIPQGFGVQSMVLIQKPTDLIDALSPYVEFNGQPVRLDGVDWEEPDPEDLRLLRQLQLSDRKESSHDTETSHDTEALGSVDGEKVEQEAERDQSAVSEQSEQASVIGKERPQVSALEKRRPRNAYKRDEQEQKSFQQVSISELSINLGQPVILYTYFGRKIEGKLVAVENNVVTVEHRLVDGRGTATYPISAEKIQTALLYR